MSQRSVPNPGIIRRIDIDPDDPEPTDCLPPDETPITTATLSPGWITLTDRAFLSYHPGRDPAIVRTQRQNVTGISLRRSGGRSLLRYVPIGGLYALAALGVGVVLLMISPADLVTVPDAPGIGGLETIVRTLGWASDLLGVVLLFSGVLVGLGAAVIVGYWLTSSEVALVFERGTAEPIECPTDRDTGILAIRTLRNGLSQ
ncbi:MAG: hypothetical protein ACQET5_05000 [Halobacteriota archaeon]|uniref:hypothetical protein n=1 Tax=Natronomonas sp. TaxID=2184060 RepID=UPI003975EAF0